MLLYVKFCGGCNPTFDRGTLVKQAAALLGAQITYSHPEQADICLLVSGCSRNCAQSKKTDSCIRVSQGMTAAELAQRINEE